MWLKKEGVGEIWGSKATGQGEKLNCTSWIITNYYNTTITTYIRVTQGKTAPKESLIRFSTSIFGTWNFWWYYYILILTSKDWIFTLFICPHAAEAPWIERGHCSRESHTRHRSGGLGKHKWQDSVHLWNVVDGIISPLFAESFYSEHSMFLRKVSSSQKQWKKNMSSTPSSRFHLVNNGYVCWS